METTYQEFQTHYRYISRVIDFLTAFQDGRRIQEETSQNSINKLLRSLRMLRDTSDYFESFTKTELDHPEHPEYPESPEDPESPDDPEGPEYPEGPDDPEGPEPWWPIKEEEQEANDRDLHCVQKKNTHSHFLSYLHELSGLNQK